MRVACACHPGCCSGQGDHRRALPAGNAGSGAGRAEMFPDTREEGVQPTSVARERVLMPRDLFTVVLSSVWQVPVPGRDVLPVPFPQSCVAAAVSPSVGLSIVFPPRRGLERWAAGAGGVRGSRGASRRLRGCLRSVRTSAALCPGLSPPWAAGRGCRGQGAVRIQPASSLGYNQI